MATAATSGEEPAADWTLTPLTEADRPLLERLMQFYFYDFSELDGDDVEEDGIYHAPDYGRYGRDRGHDAWLLRVKGKPAGFALIDLESQHAEHRDRHEVAEFHVMRAHRGRGFGTRMAFAIFDRYPGKWLVQQIGPNTDAQAFWLRVIDRYTGGRFAQRSFQGHRFEVIAQEFDTSDRVGSVADPRSP